MLSVNDVPKNPLTRAAKMARLPIGLAGRTAIGVGKRIGGRPAELEASLADRVAELRRADPLAPINVLVPPHHYESDTSIVIGVDPQGKA